MIPGRARLRIGYRVAPFIPRQEGKPSTPAEVRRHSLGVTTQRHCRGRTDMEALADCAVCVSNRELERLRNVVSVHVMHRFHPQVGKNQLLTTREPLEHRGVEMSGRVEWSPARTDDVPWMENRRSNYSLAHRIEQPCFDCRLFYPVVAKRLARLRLDGRNDGAVSVDPDGSAVQEQGIAFLERLNQMPGALLREADQIDDDVRAQGGNAVSERAGGFLC